MVSFVCSEREQPRHGGRIGGATEGARQAQAVFGLAHQATMCHEEGFEIRTHAGEEKEERKGAVGGYFTEKRVGKCVATCGDTGGLWRMTRARAAFCCEALRRGAKRWVVPDACGRAGNLLPRADGREWARRRAESRGEGRNLRWNKTLPRAQIAVSAANFKRGCRFCRESRHIRALRGCGR